MFYIKPYNTYTSGTISQSSFSVRFNSSLCVFPNLLTDETRVSFDKSQPRTSYKPILHFLTSKKIREDPQAKQPSCIVDCEYMCMCMLL